MKKQVCSSLLALTMTLGTVTPALAAETETNVQSAACTCTAACTEETRNMDCAVCGAEGAPLTDCAQVNAQDDTNNEQQTANAENGFEYTVTGDEATITGYTGSAKSLVIPSELGGKPVTEIGRFAFAHCDSLTEVTIPEGVTSIGDSAFRNCSSLTKVTIPKSVTSIGDSAFYNCDALKTVYYGGSQTDWGKISIGSDNDPLLKAEIICAIQESNGFAYTVTGDEATITGYTGSAKNLVIPSELGGKPVTAIADKAFYGYKTPNIYIPKTIKKIGEDAFWGTVISDEFRFICYEGTKNEWANIAIQKGNEQLDPKYLEGDPPSARPYECNLSGDMVYQASDNAATLVRYFGADSKVDIPAELGGKPVTEIGVGAFGFCSSLTEVTIPKSVTSIGEMAFYDCGALATVYYGGTQEDWDALEKNIGEENTPLLNANIICAIQESNGFAYTVTGDEATITGYTGSAKNIVIPSELGGKPVTAIADKAFEGYKNMVNIYIPKTIKAIGEDAFQNATSNLIRFICYEGTENEWANIAIQKGNEELNPREFDDVAWFRLYECNLSGDMVYQASDDAATLVRYFGSDSKVDIPAELGGKPVTEIGEWAFAYYSSLPEVTIPKSVTSIRAFAFRSCGSLTKAIIPEGVTSIGESAFQSCGSLTEVTIPKSVTSIESFAFSECEALATVYYGGTQKDWDALKKNIGSDNDPLLSANVICAIQESNGFEYTVTGDEATITGYTGSAKNIVIPSELGGKPVTAIGEKAFEGYKNIVNIYIPKTIKAIGEDAFQNATSNLIRFICYEGTENEWANIAIQKGNEELNPREACFRLYECNLSGDMVYQASDDAATLVRYFGSDSKVDIPAELGGKPVTEIGDNAFAYYRSLTEVTIPKSVTSIGDGAFDSCSSLTEATISEGVTSIREFAFAYCSSLTEVTIPEGVTSIGVGAFQGCNNLTEVTIPKSVTSIGDRAFYDCEALATVYYGGTQEDWDALKKNIGEENTPLLNANVICKEKPKICKGGKEVKISNGAHEMRIHGKSYGTFTFAWVDDKAGWSIQNADGKYLSFDNGKLVLRDTAYVWKYDAKFYTKTEEKTSSGWGWWGRPSTKVTNWYLVGDGTDLSISKSDTNADVKLYDAMESTEHSFGKWTPAEDGKHTRTCTICGATETGDCTYENGACTVCGALDPDNASVSVSATVTKRTSGGGGWWWWNRPTTTTWEARITATGTGVDIDKVEYSDDGKHYLTGTSFTSDTEITKFYIRVTDSKGNVTKWLYENGKVTQK
ncbi:leucine-rich repeat domain-containing protein [Butyricicoccus intestinisimiae]|uniref:Leucine-rich repeat domain-containing protein n=1 Tax=Butyricicoccus intestinisimiae TaxID=2841509 RepID=A0ABS6EPG7_9FIRM|nr:leucine-rich repeat domain-containing protein [Butyricicoccus intestinisimiae]MBU5489584.1 leucine-rich repeat domain-containing protein [Butyricicoccus intestinisimiae]